MISFPEKTSAAGGTPLLPEETWRDIPGYEGQYQASSLGRIRGLERYIEQTDRNGRVQKRHVPGRILKPYGSRTGPYMKVTINGKKIRVHKLVTEAFFGPCPKGMEVLHSNGNARDNRISNLKYGTHSENVRETYSYGGKQKTLFGEDTEQIRVPVRYQDGLKRVLFRLFSVGKYCRDSVLLTTDASVPMFLPKSCTMLPLVSDLALYRMPEVYDRSRVLLWKFQYSFPFRQAKYFLAVSEYTKKDMTERINDEIRATLG